MFTPRQIGFVTSPYKTTADVPRGLGASHQADGVLKILPEFELGLTDIEGFPSSSGSSIARRISNYSAPRPRTIVRTASLPPARPIVRIRLAKPSSSCFAATVPICMYAASICSMARLSSISNPICRASRRKNCAVDG
jgi:hypothetical protein